MANRWTLGAALISLVLNLGCASSMVSCLPIPPAYDGSARALPYSSFVGVVSETTIISNKCAPDVPQPCIEQNASMGSGAIVYRSKSHPNIGYIMTAKHVCDHMNDKPEKDAVDVKLLGHRFGIRDHLGRDHIAKYYFSSSKSLVDICILLINDMDDSLGVAELAPVGPMKGDLAFNIAAPGSFMPTGVQLTFSGFFSGSEGPVAVYTIPSAGGSSGSPIFNRDGGLIGLIWGYPTKGEIRIVEPISFSILYDDLKEVIMSIDSADVIIEALEKKLGI